MHDVKQSRAVDRSGQITSARAIAALASPVRQEIIDTIELLDGSATIAELAAQLGRPADGLYYHVSKLIAVGLLQPAGGLPGVYRTPTRRRLALDYNPELAPAVRRTIAGMLRIAKRDFDAGFAVPGVAVGGRRRSLWAGRAKGWVGTTELAELNALLARIHDILRQPRRPGAQLVSLCHVLAPIADRSARRITSRSRAGRRRTSPRRRPTDR